MGKAVIDNLTRGKSVIILDNKSAFWQMLRVGRRNFDEVFFSPWLHETFVVKVFFLYLEVLVEGGNAFI